MNKDNPGLFSLIQIGAIFLLILFSGSTFAQGDSIRNQILEYEDTKSVLISRGRKLLLDEFLKGNIPKVIQVKDYLLDAEDENYLPLFPAEHWLLLYWTREYDELLSFIADFDSVRIRNINTRIPPPQDLLFSKLQEKTAGRKEEIRQEIQNSRAKKELRQMLSMTFEYLMLDDERDLYARDTLNREAELFLEEHPESRFEYFTRQFIRYKLVPKNWGMTFEFFSGYNIFTGSLRDSYTNAIPFGVAFDICYKNVELSLRDHIAFNDSRKDVVFSKGVWEKGSRHMIFIPEAALGYVVFDNNRFKITPFAGIAATDIGPSAKDLEKTPELEEVSLKFTTTYTLGMNLDIKFGPSRTPDFSPKASYGFMRIRYSFNNPEFERKYTGMDGKIHCITIGFGAMARRLKREY